MRGRAAPPHPGIYRVPPSGYLKTDLDENLCLRNKELDYVWIKSQNYWKKTFENKHFDVYRNDCLVGRNPGFKLPKCVQTHFLQQLSREKKFKSSTRQKFFFGRNWVRSIHKLIFVWIVMKMTSTEYFFPLGSTKISDYANGPKPCFAKIFFKKPWLRSEILP